MQAARLVAADVGIQGASMSAIADRSGVGKPTIYLRWANRADLMVAAVADLREPVVAERTGSVREDLHRSLVEDRELFVVGEHSRFLRSVLFECAVDEVLAREFEESIVGPRRERLATILVRGVDDGQIRPGIDPNGLADLLACPLLRAMVLVIESLDADSLRAHVDVILDGVGDPSGASVGSSR